MRDLSWMTVLISLSMTISSALATGPLEIVYDPTVDADIIQTFNFFEHEIADLEKQLGDLDKALQVLASGKYLWSNTTALVNQLSQTMAQANGLSYAAKNEETAFSVLFPGYTVSNNFNQQYQKMTQSALDTLNNTLKNMQVSANNFLNENGRLQALQNFTQGVVDQTQALQMAAQMASEQVSQLQLLRQSIMAQANAQIVYYAQQIQKEASAVADLNAVIANGDKQTTGNLNTHPIEKPNYQ